MTAAQTVDDKDSLPTGVPTDALPNHPYRPIRIYGAPLRDLIHQEFGDGTVSAVDLSMEIVRNPDSKGNRVMTVMSGKFLPYKPY